MDDTPPLPPMGKKMKPEYQALPSLVCWSIHLEPVCREAFMCIFIYSKCQKTHVKLYKSLAEFSKMITHFLYCYNLSTHGRCSYVHMTQSRSPSLSVQPGKCLSTALSARCPSVSFTVSYHGGVLQGIWAGRQPASCWLTRSRPRSPLTDTGPGGRHSPSGWTWRDRNKEIHCYGQCATHTLVTIWFINGVSCCRIGMGVLFFRLWQEHLNAVHEFCLIECDFTSG